MNIAVELQIVRLNQSANTREVVGTYKSLQALSEAHRLRTTGDDECLWDIPESQRHLWEVVVFKVMHTTDSNGKKVKKRIEVPEPRIFAEDLYN